MVTSLQKKMSLQPVIQNETNFDSQVVSPDKLAGLLNFLYKCENSDENHWGSKL